MIKIFDLELGATAKTYWSSGSYNVGTILEVTVERVSDKIVIPVNPPQGYYGPKRWTVLTDGRSKTLETDRVKFYEARVERLVKSETDYKKRLASVEIEIKKAKVDLAKEKASL